MLGVLLFLAVCGYALSPGRFSFSPEDVSVDTLFYGGMEYHQIAVDGLSLPANGLSGCGQPAVPESFFNLLLPPASSLDSVLVLSVTWDSLPGKYHLLPIQSAFIDDSIFSPEDTTIYNSGVFPKRPVRIVRQGSAMGYSVATLAVSPVRYAPKDSTVWILSSLTLEYLTSSGCGGQVVPERETQLSASVRERGILSMITNPEDISLYAEPLTCSFSGRASALDVTETPSAEGDAVDMVVITNEELAPAFEPLAEYRTQLGIVTVVRTVEWIALHYPGSDLPEKIRNFLADANLHWGTQAVLLGGDDGVVPVRKCSGWNYVSTPFPLYLLPSDDYYADIDGLWSLDAGRWIASSSNSYLDLCVGRWPVNTLNDVERMFTKLQLYEFPEQFPDNFARKVLLMGSDNQAGTGAADMMELSEMLVRSSAVPALLDHPTMLLYPHSLPGGDLCRQTALDEFDQGYNLVVHADHSGLHKLATAGKGTLGQYIWDSDFSTMSNDRQPSILWTLGCDTGQFDGAYCFSEAGLLASDSTGLVAVVSNARAGIHQQKTTAYAFTDALFNTGWIESQLSARSLQWPLSFLGEAYRCSKNVTDLSFIFLNLFGSPFMSVWRGNPDKLSISLPPVLLREGITSDLTVTVTSDSLPVKDATVCLWKKDELFSLAQTDSNGSAFFSGICLADGSTDLIITASKRRQILNPFETVTASYIPARVSCDVLPSDAPVVSLAAYDVDPLGDGFAAPGETVDINIFALNSGGEAARFVSVELSPVYGEQYIHHMVNSNASIPDIEAGQTAAAEQPFLVEIDKNVPDNSTIGFSLLFTYADPSGQIMQWESPLTLTVLSENYELTLLNPVSENSNGRTAEVNLSDMLLVNTGLGAATALSVTIDNLRPPEPFQATALTLPGIPGGGATELDGELDLLVLPQDPRSPWLQKDFPGCSFDVVVESTGGDYTARSVDAEQVFRMQPTPPEPPTDLHVYEVGSDHLSLVWDYTGTPAPVGFCVYCDDGITNHRVFPLPVPVRQITINNLLPGRDYAVSVTAVDSLGRESDAVETGAFTSSSQADGWPVFLQGSPGAGAAVAEIDGDPDDELVVASAFGIVYLIEKDGTHRELLPPSGFDFDRFLGCAVGDVDGDSQQEIVVSCQRKIEVQDHEQVVLILFDRSGETWSATEIASTGVNEEVSSPDIAGTPVLFQADGGGTMEIALRTRGNNGGSPHLYVWRYNPASAGWVSYDSLFPIALSGFFFSCPTAVDFDEDGLEELVVSSYGSGGSGTAFLIVDFSRDDEPFATLCNLSELDTSGETARAFGTTAAAQENGLFYLAGVAKNDAQCSDMKKLFVYRLNTNPIGVSLVWQTDWLTGNESFGNMPGPAIGNTDSDPSLEVVYSLNGGSSNSEGFVRAWNLLDGSAVFESDAIPFNPVLGYGASDAKSQPVIATTDLPGYSADMALFSGFSTFACAHSPHSGTSMLDGFPSGSTERLLASPLVCDLDHDGIPEVLFIDYSGFASLFELSYRNYSPEGWHMYQDNPQRTGFYNTDLSPSQMRDIRVLGASRSESATLHTSVGGSFVSVDVEISGFEPPGNTSEIAPENQSSLPLSFPSVAQFQKHVEIALFADGILVGTAEISLENGRHTVAIPLPAWRLNGADITVTADPFNEYAESDETNNSSTLQKLMDVHSGQSLCVPTPAHSVQLILQLSKPDHNGICITVYSVDGRVVAKEDTENLPAGRTTLNIGEDLPSGVYTVRIEGMDTPQTRKVVILH